jgi:hypothetical protein
LFLSNVLLTGKEMGQHFYVMEVFVTSIVFFVVAPIVIILGPMFIGVFDFI